MKRLDNHLLTNYPLLWNLRVHWVWPAIIALHVLFFIAGYVPVSFPDSLTSYTLRTGEGTVSLAVLTALLVGVLWIVFYFRNNAFKSFYPIERGRLAAEAGLIFVTCLGLTTFTASFESARYLHVRAISTSVNLLHEADVTNLAHHFLPFSQSEFSTRSDCSYNDSGKNQPVATDRAESITPQLAVDTFSYLHYCSLAISCYHASSAGIRDARENDAIAKRWLLAGRRDSVQALLNEYLALCKKYGGEYRFDAGRHVAAIFAGSGFPVSYELRQNDYNEDSTRGILRMADGHIAFVSDQTLTRALETVEEARDGWLDPSVALFFLYFALGITLIIFSFRITAVRTWFIALIGVGIWMAVFGVLGAGLRGGGGIAIIFLMLSLASLIAAGLLIGRRNDKTKAGVLYLWALWSVPAFMPTLMGVVRDLIAPVERYDARANAMMMPPAPLYDWLGDHRILIGFGNLALYVFLLLLLLIPLARKWQAMPEE